MEPVDVGILSLLPPIIAISLALVTKEVISSLMLGILSGGLIYAAASGGGLVAMSSAAFEIMSKTVGTPDKFNIILFLALLGALVCVVNKAGGSQAYGQWATRKITSRRAAELVLPCIINIRIFSRLSISRFKLFVFIFEKESSISLYSPQISLFSTSFTKLEYLSLQSL